MSVAQDKVFDQVANNGSLSNRHDEGDGDSNEDDDDDDDDDEEDQIPKIRIGICAMNKKTKSPPMQEILGRMSMFDCVDIFVFSDDTIFNVPVEEWPICDCLISFYSNGFPLEKAIEYTKLRKPFSLNDLEMQYALMDRPTMYSLLESAGIETPRHAILLRDDDGNPTNTKFIELDDSVQIDDMVFQKPFVEKPVNAEDHNVYIYFPSRAGGGSQRLFRKVGNRSSVYSPESSVRKEGSYIYEDFVVTDGVDLKVYTVGPEYAHAEARKSPSLDGKVERDSEGKEIRYPVILSQYEKEMANKVCKMFKQTVCGCDFLRTHGKSYVCDVNGFSFVKTSKKYYDDAAQVLIGLIAHKIAPQLYKPYNLDVPEEIRKVEVMEGTMLELRCVVGIIRHGDRTPKQKMKMEVRHPRFIELFKKYDGFDKLELKLKRPTQLEEVLNIARDLVADVKKGKPLFENPNKIHQLKTVLEMYGNFSGINEKIQFKYLGKPRERNDSDIRERKYGNSDKEAKKTESREAKTESSKDSKENEAPVDKDHSLLLILKWGGELTMMGRHQALELGRAFRSMYPGGQGQYSELSGYGLLRLHSTYRHDLKIYASDEGRVQMTAAAFAKGFLALEGELAPVLVHLVRSDKSTTEMLDTPSEASKILGKVKHRLHDLLHSDEDFKEEDFAKLAPTKNPSLINAMKFVKNPYKMCERLYKLVQSLTGQLKELIAQKNYDPRDPFLYQDETLELMMHRWTKLEKDFKLKSGRFDISLIPDIYDCIKYDVQHNSDLNLENSLELYKCAKAFADIVIPQEYGITKEEKLGVSQSVCTRLLKKIRGDLRHADKTDIHTRLNPDYMQSVEAPHRHVRTRLYFTSESHVHTVVNALKFGNLFEEMPDNQWQRAVDFLAEVPELNYMTQIVLMLYEDPKADPLSDKRFHVELHFSPGAKTTPRKRSMDETVSSVCSFATADTYLESSDGTSSSGDDIEDFQPYDEGVYTENELPRCEIGLDDYADDSVSENTTPSVMDSGDFFAEENVIRQKRSVSDLAGNELERKDTEDKRLYSEGNDKPERHSLQNSLNYSERPSDKSKTVPRRLTVSFELTREKEADHFDDPFNRTDESSTPSVLPRRCDAGFSVDDSDISSATVIEESSQKENLLTRQSAETEPTDSRYVLGEQTKQQDQPKDAEVAERRNSTGSGSGSEGSGRSRKYSGVPLQPDKSVTVLPKRVSFELVRDQEDDDYIEDQLERFHESVSPSIERPFAKRHSVGVLKRPTDILNPANRKVSFELVRNHGRGNFGGPLVVIDGLSSPSRPSTRKQSSGTASSAILALQSLTYAIQSALVVRPHSLTNRTRKSRKPPVAEFYEEMTKVESLNPLRTLHNAVPLKEIDNFFDTFTGNKLFVHTLAPRSKTTTMESNFAELPKEEIGKLDSSQQ